MQKNKNIGKKLLLITSLYLFNPNHSWSANILINGLTTGSDVSTLDGSTDLSVNTSKTLGNITSTSNGTGSIIYSGANNLTVDGNIGSSTSNKIDTIDFSTHDGTLTLAGSSGTSNVYVANGISTSTNNQGSIYVSATNSEIHADIGASGSRLKSITFDGATTASIIGVLSGDLYASTLTLTNGSNLSLETNVDNIGIPTINISSDSTLSIYTDNVTLNNITTNGGTVKFITGTISDETINFSGSNTIDSDIVYAFPTSTYSLPQLVANNNASIDLSNVTNLNVSFDSGATAPTSGTQYTIVDSSATGASIDVTADNIGVTTNLPYVTFMPQKVNNTLVLTTYNIKDYYEINDARANLILDAFKYSSNSSLRTNLINITSTDNLKIVGEKVDVAKDADALSTIQTTSKINNIISSRASSVASRTAFPYGNGSKSSGIWGQIFSGKVDQDSTTDQEGYDLKTYGFALGADTAIGRNDNSILGLAFAYANSDTTSKLAGNKESQINTYQVSLYNNNSNGHGTGFYNENILSYGINKYQTKRTIEIGSFSANPSASFNGKQYSARIGFGYNATFFGKILSFTPNTYFEYQKVTKDSYDETGGNGLGLSVKSDAINTYVSGLGAKMAMQLRSSYLTFIPKLDATWIHSYNRDGSKTTVSLISSNTTVTSTGNNLLSDYANIGAELEITNRKNSTFFLRYDLQKGRGLLGQIGSFKYRWMF